MPMSPTSRKRRVVRKRLADGTIKTYEYNSPPRPRSKGPALPVDSVRELLAAYERSPEWTGLAPRTKKARLIALRHLYPVYHMSVAAALRRREILTMRDGIAAFIGPAAANAFAAHLAAVLAWAEDREWIEHSPARRIQALPGGHFPTWTEGNLTKALEAVSEPLRRVLLMAVHTGQRRGDLVGALWSQIAGGTWRMTQEKTGKRLAIPLHPDLLAEIDVWRRDASAVTVLTQAAGTPWPRDGVTMALMRALKPIGLKGLNLHGLRKLAAVRLAEAGCSVHEIAAILGHDSLAHVALYTRDADQERLATAAVHRLQTGKQNRQTKG